MKTFITLIAVGFIVGCTTTTSKQKSASVYTEAPTTPEKSVRAWMEKTLFDPYSVKSFAISEPSKGSVWTGFVNQGRVPAWYVCARFNAKNRYGAYTGIKTQVLHFREQSVWVANNVNDVEMHEHNCKSWVPAS